VIRVAGIALALVACGDNIDAQGHGHGIEDKIAEWLTQNGAVLGTVYRCESAAWCANASGGELTEEWCYWEDSELELEQLLGGTCHPIKPTERLYPSLAGCAYACPPLARGCNAHCGCFCEGAP
jgi:hypothetical protein